MAFFMGQMGIMGLKQAAWCILPRPGSVKLSAEKAAFSAKQKVQVLHAAVDLDAKMHEAEDVCKQYLQLYAFIFNNDAFMRLLRVCNP
jgi:hypothetical protein